MNRSILRLAIPNIFTNITIPLLGMVDMGLMGHMGSASYVGAVALGGMIFSFLFWAFSFLRMGTSGFTAQAFGRRDLKEASHILARSWTSGLVAGILLILLQWPIEWVALKMIHGSAEVEALAASYFAIRIYAAPATLSIYAFYGWFIGMQNAKIPMTMAICINLVNIGCSLFFIRILHMNSNGLAWANLISQYLGLVMGALFVGLYVPRLRKYFDLREAFRISAFRSFISVNKDIFIRTLCLIFTLSFFTTQSANQSPVILAVNTLLFQFFYFFSYFVDGFSYAAEALAGKYIGAGEPDMLKKTVRRLFIWGMGIALVFTLVYASGSSWMLNILTDDSKILEAAPPFFFWIILVPLLTFAAFIWDGIYVGATASRAMRNSMLIITLCIFLPSFYILRPLLGNHGLWLALMLFMGSRGIFLTILSKEAVFQRISK